MIEGILRSDEPMNELGVLLIGCIVRCTLLAAAGLALGAILKRRGPATGSLVSLTTLVVLLAVPFLGRESVASLVDVQPVLSPSEVDTQTTTVATAGRRFGGACTDAASRGLNVAGSRRTRSRGS